MSKNAALITVLVAILCAGLGWSTGRSQLDQETLNVRRVLLDEMTHNRSLLQECFTNLENQFTPGFRSAQVLYDPKNVTYSMQQGKIVQSSTRTHLAIKGAGFFQIQHKDQRCYTRDGRFLLQDGFLKAETGGSLLGYQYDQQGKLGTSLQPLELSLSVDTKLYLGRFYDFYFSEDGIVWGTDHTGKKTALYKLELAGFENPERLERVGSTLFRETPQAQLIRQGSAGDWNLGSVAQGHLEASNVDWTEQGLVIEALRKRAGLLGDVASETGTRVRVSENPMRYTTNAAGSQVQSMAELAGPMNLSPMEKAKIAEAIKRGSVSKPR